MAEQQLPPGQQANPMPETSQAGPMPQSREGGFLSSIKNLFGKKATPAAGLPPTNAAPLPGNDDASKWAGVKQEHLNKMAAATEPVAPIAPPVTADNVAAASIEGFNSVGTPAATGPMENPLPDHSAGSMFTGSLPETSDEPASDLAVATPALETPAETITPAPIEALEPETTITPIQPVNREEEEDDGGSVNPAPSVNPKPVTTTISTPPSQAPDSSEIPMPPSLSNDAAPIAAPDVLAEAAKVVNSIAPDVHEQADEVVAAALTNAPLPTPEAIQPAPPTSTVDTKEPELAPIASTAGSNLSETNTGDSSGTPQTS